MLEIDGRNGNIDLVGRIIDIGANENGISRGFQNRTSDPSLSTGNIRSLGGVNTYTAPQFRLRHSGGANGTTTTVFLGVDAGSFDIIASIVGLQNDATPTASNGKNIFKTGDGLLRYSGTTANQLTGTTAVMAGTLELNKTPDVADGGTAVGGTLQIGDNVTTAMVKLSQSEQLAMGQAINVSSTGTLDFANATDNTSTTATLTIGATTSGKVLTSPTGNWVHRGDVTVTPRPGINTAVSSSISGNVQLTTGAAAARVYTVNDSPADVELIVTANITDIPAFAGGISKAGAGRMSLAPTTASTYTGAVAVTAGVLRITGDTAPGSTAAELRSATVPC